MSCLLLLVLLVLVLKHLSSAAAPMAAVQLTLLLQGVR
jgi:hypothetical protein